MANLQESIDHRVELALVKSETVNAYSVAREVLADCSDNVLQEIAILVSSATVAKGGVVFCDEARDRPVHDHPCLATTGTIIPFPGNVRRHSKHVTPAAGSVR